MPYFDPLTYEFESLVRSDSPKLFELASSRVEHMKNCLRVPMRTIQYAEQTLKLKQKEEIRLLAYDHTFYKLKLLEYVNDAFESAKDYNSYFRVANIAAAIAYEDYNYHHSAERIREELIDRVYDRIKYRNYDELKDAKVLLVNAKIENENKRYTKVMTELSGELWEVEHIDLVLENIKRQKEKKEEERIEREKGKAQKEIEKAEELARKIEKQREMQLTESKKRNSTLESFNALSLNNKLETICNDTYHVPDYYGLDYSCITDKQLSELPKDLLRRVTEVYIKYNNKSWKHFQKRIKNLLAENE